jgi:arylsulfatase A
MSLPSIERRSFLKSFSLGITALAATQMSCATKSKRSPNFIIIMTDDQGYQDVGVYGAEGFETPHLDKMASEGMRFTDYYVASSVCSPSRAALMTGCYPMRVGITHVLFPTGPIYTKGVDNMGLSTKEKTIASMLKTKGYATGCYGKWHLGHHKEFLPLSHGFDEYFGIPYSNDMWPATDPSYPPLPLVDGYETIETEPDQSQITTRYTERAVEFIKKNKDNPFFVYMPHSMPHVPLFVSDKFKGKSKQGMYGDVIMEIDWSVGQILKTVKELGLDNDTFVMFTSDNGPWLCYGNHSGAAKPLREGKRTSFDGGQRVPCIMRWPGTIPAAVDCNEMVTSMDLLPTVAAFSGAALPENKIDGKEISDILKQKDGAQSPHEAFYFYLLRDLEAVRSGKWKLHFPHKYFSVEKVANDGERGSYFTTETELALFDLEADIGETTNVAAQYPEVVEKLKALADKAREELGDGDKMGIGAREPGRIKL